MADAMTGQDAVRSAAGFAAALPLTGIILTKTDGDARGGAALTVVSTLDKPIKFVGVGEKPEDFEPFHPDRMASRILGLGDVLDADRKGRGAGRRGVGAAPGGTLAPPGSSRSRTCATSSPPMKKMGPLSSLVDLLPEGRARSGASPAPESVDEKALGRVYGDHRLHDAARSVATPRS